MKGEMREFGWNFVRCGVLGWCLEIVFTSLDAFKRKDYRLKGNTSIWMFPIYGCAAFLAPVSKLLGKKPFWVRGLTYMSLIFSMEYLSGRLLWKHQLCPWDYAKCRWNIKRVIRLDFAPCWFGAGLLFERLLSVRSRS